MTDLEMLQACAEAMGVTGVRLGEGGPLYKVPPEQNDYIVTNPLEYLKFPLYDPLHDDAQAMALLHWLARQGRVSFEVGRLRFMHSYGGELQSFMAETDEQRRRAICECVAKLTAANG